MTERRKWASAAERVAHYSREYQRKLAADKGPKGEDFRARRREADRKRRERAKTDPEKIRALTEKVARANAARRAKQAVDNRQKRARAAVEDAKAQAVRLQRSADGKRHTNALATMQTVVVGESVAEFVARGGQVEVLAVNWQAPIPRRYVTPTLY